MSEVDPILGSLVLKMGRAVFDRDRLLPVRFGTDARARVSNRRSSFIKDDMSRQLVAPAAKLPAHVILRPPIRRV